MQNRYLFLIIAFLVGFYNTALQKESSNVRFLTKDLENVHFCGTVDVIKYDMYNKKYKIIFKDHNIKNVSRIQISFYKLYNVQKGDRACVRASIFAIKDEKGNRDYQKFDIKTYAQFSNIGAFGYARSKIYGLEQNEKTSSILEQLKKKILHALEQKLEQLSSFGKPEYSGFAKALAINNKEAIGKNYVQTLQNIGVIHLMVLSGYHLGIISLVIFIIFRNLFLFFPIFSVRYNAKKIVSFLVIIFVIFYGYLTGFPTSLVRASIMIIVVMFANILNKPVISLKNIVIAMFLMLLYNPYYLFNIGFQMSFLATLGIIVLWESSLRTGIEKYFPILAKSKIMQYVVYSALLTIIAELFIFIVLVQNFNAFPKYSILANLLISPIFNVLIMPFLVFYVLFPMGNFASSIFAYFYAKGIDAFLLIVKLVSSFPSPVIYVSSLSGVVITIFMLILFFIVVLKAKYRHYPLYLLFFLSIWVLNKSLPTMVIMPFNKVIAVRQDDIYVFSDKVSKFARESLPFNRRLRTRLFAKNNKIVCDDNKCMFGVASKTGVYIKNNDIKLTCQEFDIFVGNNLNLNCPHVFDFNKLKQRQEIYIKKDKIIVK